MNHFECADIYDDLEDVLLDDDEIYENHSVEDADIYDDVLLDDEEIYENHSVDEADIYNRDGRYYRYRYRSPILWPPIPSIGIAGSQALILVSVSVLLALEYLSLIHI